MPTKKESCTMIQRGVAGPTPDEVIETIRAEYWLPARAKREPDTGAGEAVPQPDETSECKPTEVKP